MIVALRGVIFKIHFDFPFSNLVIQVKTNQPKKKYRMRHHHHQYNESYREMVMYIPPVVVECDGCLRHFVNMQLHEPRK